MLIISQKRLFVNSLIGLALLCSAACESENTSTTTVLLESEDLVTEGLDAGDDTENIRDGWSVTFDKYIVTIGNIELQKSTDQTTSTSAPEVYVTDLTQVPVTGQPLWSFEDLEEGRWDFNYATPKADTTSIQDSSVSQSDYNALVDNGWTYLIAGTLTKSTGESCPPMDLATPGDKQATENSPDGNACYTATSISFSFGVSAETRVGPCEIDEIPGFVSEGTSQTVAATIHGDHLFFNGFPEGSEGDVRRLAQWLADCDLNLDGEVTKEELEGIAPAALPAIDGYKLGGSPITPLNTMYDYVASQLKTQAHFQGEGECPLK